jgi:tetratricopeptide (TPR) repeat protein
MKTLRFHVLCLVLLAFGHALAARAEEVRVWEGKLDLPTYLLGTEDPNPPFALISHRRVYPYTMQDDLTERRETKTYRALFLENEYLKAIVLPEMGGRLYSLYDKVAKREVFYRNNVVKYGLVALRGAWISGGIEFNFPDGHTTVTVSPVASTFLHGSDGSGTIVVGNVDLVTGMCWEVAMTLRPGQARLEELVTLYNATPRTNLHWYWQNTAVPATEDMQFIYPMREACPHIKGVLWSYPIHDGVDYSWYKNVREAASLFGRQVHRNFFGAYYHKPDYGVAHVADFREVPGKKIWTWGVAGDGLIWTDLLTDGDGPYNEIQAGRFETQLNYEFMPPRRVESFTEYWYPVAGLEGGFVEATPELALNVRFLPAQGSEGSQVEILVSPVVSILHPKLVVKLGSEAPKEFTPPSFSPLKTDKLQVPVANIEEARKGLTVEVKSADGQSLLHWSAADPVDGNKDFVPAAGAKAPPPKPLEAMTVQELFLHGVSVEKDGREEAAAKIYRQVLERDPGFVPALLKQAWQLHRAGDFQGAERSIYRALARNPLNPDANYAAGVIYRSSQRWTLAEDALWASLHFGGPQAPALAQLGEIAIHEKKFDEAAELLRRALSFNPGDALAKADLAVALRLAGRREEAVKTINETVADNPLFPWALAEQWRLSSGGEAGDEASQGKKSWAASLTPGVETYLSVAAWYRSLDDLVSSDAVLKAALDELPAGSASPMVYYYLASNARREDKGNEAKQYAAEAAAAPFDKVFPHRLEDALVLDEARRENPLDAHAPYFLGNFLFAVGRYDDAARMWMQALGTGFEYSVLSRNLGVYAWRVKKDLEGAAGFFEKAIELAPEDYRLYVSLDEIYASLGDQAQREKLMANAPPTVAERDTVRVRRALVDLQQKRYGQALEALADHSFKPWEGGQVVRHVYVAANLEEGRASLAAGKPREAEPAFRRALEYPVNLGVGKPDKPHDEEALYWLGEALQAAGDAQGAKEVWSRAAVSGKDTDGTGRVFAALAMRRLGQTEEADKILDEFLQTASSEKAGASSLYAAGLVQRYRDLESEARKLFQRAIDVAPDFWPAQIELDRAPL